MDYNQSGIIFYEPPSGLEVKEAVLALTVLAEREGFKPGKLVYNFVPREKIIEINKTYLDHHYPTDIITFDYVEGRVIHGEIFICPDVVEENADALGFMFLEELKRVILHGTLHLMGYDDSSNEQKSVMRNKEDEGLSIWKDVM